MVRLGELVAALGGTWERDASGAGPDIRDVHVDSRRAGAGTLFAALPGTREDGARFAPDALARGAAAVLSARRLDADCANWVHPEVRRVAGEAAALVHGRPAQDALVVGVTGTNGKTTVACLCGQLLERLGARPAVLGTVGHRLWGETLPATHTTPDATELQRLCRRHRDLGGDAIVLEVSSHALDQERVAGLWLDVAVFTNLTREHLDYHRTMEAYAAAKARIFERLKPGGTAVVGIDDGWAPVMIDAARARGARVVTFGIGSRADLRADRPSGGRRGTHLFLEGMGVPWTGLTIPLVGRHNVENALAASAAVLSLGASPSRVLEGLAAVTPPPGRLEPIDTGARGFRVFVDYAHTPDALERVLEALGELLAESAGSKQGRLLCVFGCGGERDRDKRATMGAAVAARADVALVTSDNPRGEDPEAILQDVLAGMGAPRGEVVVELDRRAAIRAALERARPNDVVLIAGKGHETWQQLSDRRVPFDDRQVAAEALR